jgi:prepilin-type processing-associated H-X9-DG protein
MGTYTVIAHDRNQYGPVSEEQLRQWIRDGRANAQTRAQVEGSTEWKTLGLFPEFQADLAAAAPSAPPPLTAPTQGTATAKISGMAVTSLVLGILGLFSCGITALVGLILGIIAMVRIKNSQGSLNGNGLALAGTIVSGIFLLMVPILAAMLLPALASAKQKAMEVKCITNEKQLAMALMIFSQDNTNHFPAAAKWCDAIKEEIGGQEQVFKCPDANPESRCDYAFNSKLDGLPVSAVSQPATTVLIFESDAGWNANGGPELLPATPRHLKNFYVVAFVDGHVEAVNRSRLNTLRWDP